MSQRERWVIYPLLFLALMLAARDTIPPFKADESKHKTVICQELIVRSEDGSSIMRIEGRPDGKGPLVRFGGDGSRIALTVDAESRTLEGIGVEKVRGLIPAELIGLFPLLEKLRPHLQALPAGGAGQ